MKTTIQTEDSKTTSEPAEESNPSRRTGRPKTRPDSRQASFHIPIALLDKIDAEAVEACGGNKSFLIIRMVEKWFADKDK